MPPVTLLIKPASSLCNMRCKYCFYADVTKNREIPSYGVMTEETLEALVEKALSAATGSCGFAFQGGEPTLAGLPFFEKLIELQQKHNKNKVRIFNSIQTNGYVIDDAWAAYFRRNRFLIGLSMDGDAVTHNALRPDANGKGTYNRILRSAATLKKHGCDFNILCVITREIARHGARIYNALKGYGYIQFIPCIDDFGGEGGGYSLSAEDYGAFLNTTFDLYCRDYHAGNYVSVRNFDNYVHLLLGNGAENCAMNGVCSCNLVIEGDGSAYPCDFYVLDKWRLGNIKTDSLASLYESQTARDFVDISKEKDDACRSCPWLSLCRGGCRRDREPEVAGRLSQNRFCEAYKVFFEKSYPMLETLARQVAANNRR